MKKNLGIAVLLILLLTTLFGTVSAQTYYFAVPVVLVELYINPDGTVNLSYEYTFQNDASADPIEYVDIGLPTSGYSLSNVSASVDGQRITNIYNADPQYVSDGQGVTLELGSLAIPPGSTGTVVMKVTNVSGLLYEADEPENYASFVFMPNYFDKSLVNGKSDYTMVIYMPQGMTEEEPRYFPAERWPGNAEPDYIGYTDDDRVYYAWVSTEANVYSQYRFGGALPMTFVPAESVNPKPTFADKFGFFVSSTIEKLFPMCCVAIFIGGPIGLGILQSKQQKKRKLQYLPPKVRIEGHGIKRGLTAVQAALLLEKPMDQIITMILFSVIRKGAAEVIQQNPLKIRALEPEPEGLYPYEKEFIEAMLEPKMTSQRRKLQITMTNLVKSVNEKMKGFSFKETVAYYEDIVKRAWTQVETAGTPDIAMESYDKYMAWTMLDDDYQGRTQTVFANTRPVYVPLWWGRYSPSYRAASVGSESIKPSGSSTFSPMSGGKPSMPALPGADFAAGVVLGAQNFAANTIGDLTAFTEGITNKTNPIPKPTSSGSSFRGGGSSGGRSCACACACAGCACACAGGGR
ncbi:MAG: hypothetical protein HPY85_06945 [Anaerolineae bacterium]|nr:hypothetical protein [Anaerolineae bacterium]